MNKGFSLTEVVLALGVVAFVLPAMLGLFSVGMNAAAEAQEKTTLAAMTTQVVSRLGPAGMTDCYFDEQGCPTDGDAAHYHCRISFRPISEEEIAGVGAAFSLATLTFTWPAAMPMEKRPHSRIVYASYLP